MELSGGRGDIHGLNKRKIAFTRLFLLANRLQAAGDRRLGGVMTINQWLLAAAIAQFGDFPPTLGQTAELMGSSHQNIKQLAMKLHKRRLLRLERDIQDLRITRLVLTDEGLDFLRKKQGEIESFFTALFEDFSEAEVNTLKDCLNKLYGSVSKGINSSFDG